MMAGDVDTNSGQQAAPTQIKTRTHSQPAIGGHSSIFHVLSQLLTFILPLLPFRVTILGAVNALYTHYSRGFSGSLAMQLCLYQHRCNMARHRRKCETISWRLLKLQ